MTLESAKFRKRVRNKCGVVRRGDLFSPLFRLYARISNERAKWKGHVRKTGSREWIAENAYVGQAHRICIIYLDEMDKKKMNRILCDNLSLHIICIFSFS